MTCQHCPCVQPLEAENEALRDQLHDVGVELADARSTLQTYQQHSSVNPGRRITLTPLVVVR
jgi:hypothetical protein